MKKFCCGQSTEKIEQLCEKHMDCYINNPKYYNCFFVYMHYNRGKQHTLQEVAALIGMSHTTVKCIEDQALTKLKEILNADESELSEFRNMEPLNHEN